MSIHVKLPDGEWETFDRDDEITWADLKAVISQQTGIPYSKFALVYYNDYVLESDTIPNGELYLKIILQYPCE